MCSSAFREASLHAVGEADLRHQPETTAVRLAAEHRSNPDVEAGDETRVEQVIDPETELGADDELSWREQQRHGHVDAEREANVRVHIETHGCSGGERETPGRAVSRIDLEARVRMDEQRHASGA